METRQAGTQQAGYQGEFTGYFIEDVADGCLTVAELEEKARQFDQLVAEELLPPGDSYGVSVHEAWGILQSRS